MVNLSFQVFITSIGLCQQANSDCKQLEEGEDVHYPLFIFQLKRQLVCKIWRQKKISVISTKMGQSYVDGEQFLTKAKSSEYTEVRYLANVTTLAFQIQGKHFAKR